MAYIETLKESMIKDVTPGTADQDVYPATSSQAVFRQNASGQAPSGVRQKLEDSLVDIENDISNLGSSKQDNILDLETIRSGAAAGATAYQLPVAGIPKADLASGVQTSLGKADSAYQLPGTGVPKTDLASGIQGSLDLADSAYQLPQTGVPRTDLASDIQATLERADALMPTSSEIENVLNEVVV